MRTLQVGFYVSVLLTAATTTRAVTFLEAGGRVVVEAEHFDTRTVAVDNHHWHVVPGDNGTDFLADSPADTGVPDYLNARGSYITSLPNAGQNKSGSADLVGTDPVVTYKVQITTPGEYQLWIRWSGYSGDSDSLYAQIVELIDGAGPNADWYRYADGGNPDDGDFSTKTGGG